MGSLVPGWDSETLGRPSKEWEDFKEGEEPPKGYFERYNELKASRKNMEANLGAEDATYPADQSASLARTSSRSLTRSGSMPYERPGRHLSPERHLQSTGRDGASGLGSPEGTKHDKHDDQDKWWCRLSSAVLNEPDADQGKLGAKSTYTPQYSVTGQRLNYHLSEEADDTEELLRKIFPPGAHDEPEPEPDMSAFPSLSTSAPPVVSASR